MSGIYLDQHGYPAYAEDKRRGAIPPEWVEGMERVEIDAENIDPSHIFQLMVERTWAKEEA